MNALRSVPLVAAVAFPALAFLPATIAQTTNESATSLPADSGDVVVLNVFEVSAAQTGRYQADESASGGRIRAEIADTPATVTVLTRDFIDDVGTLRVLDAAKYVAGISEATIPNGLDRVNIRGFQSDGRRVDGFSTNDQANYDTAGIERMEIIMGPDAILQPAGVPGGTINLVTKTPKFQRSGYITVQAGEYDSNRLEIDSTGPLSKNAAYRVVAALHDSDGYIDRSFRESFYIAPSLSWRMAPATQLTIRFEHYSFRTNSLEGIPIDPLVGTNDPMRLLDGVAHDFSPALDDDYQFRKVTARTGTFLFTSTVTDQLSVRLAGRLMESNTPDRGMNWGPNTQGGARDPQTGLWVGGTVFGGAPNFTPSTAPALNRTFTHSGTNQQQYLYQYDLQNDWAYKLDFDSVKSLTSAGIAQSYEYQRLKANTQRGQTFDIDNFVRDTAAPTQSAITTNRRRELARTQFYIAEKVDLFNERVILSGGLTHLTFNGYFGNKLTNNGRMFPGSGNATTASYGIVTKPVSDVSLYYGHTENAVPTTNFEQVTNGSAPTFSEGTQDEYGVKVQLFQKRLLLSLAYYEISQTGYSIANPANLTSPPPPVLLPPIITDRIADGWEFQASASLTKNLSLMASYADTKNRDPYGIPFRGAAEESGAAYVRYEFTDGALRGLSIGLGTNYVGKRAGDQASGLTAASTPTNLIANQPSFYLPSRTLADLTFTYTRENWSYRLAIKNLFDELDYAASQTRFNIYMGNPRTLSGSVTWKF